jgi:YidC/Oxa1 family membrane protein insertase
MERRVFIAVLLSFAVLYTYQTFLVPSPPTQPSSVATPTGAAQGAPVVGAQAPEGSTGIGSAVQPVPAAIQEPLAAAVVGEPVEREITVDTKDSEVVLSNRGARVVRWRLKAYADGSGGFVDLVPSALPAGSPTPFTLRVDDAALSARLQSGLYRVTGEAGGRVDATKEAARLVFEFEDAAGLHVTKTFVFEPSRYLVRFSASVQNGAAAVNPTVVWGPGLGDAGATSAGGSFFTGNYVQPPQAIYFKDGSETRHTPEDVLAQPAYDGAFRFVGIDDHYFLTAAIKSGPARAMFRPVTVAGPNGSERKLLSYELTFAESPKDALFFVGPKQFDLLKSIDPEFSKAINFGWLAPLIVQLLVALNWLFGFLGNYGWSIIALTIGLNLAMFPLRHKAAVAMRKMQQVQPLMKAIQDRYAHLKMTDPGRQKMQEEVAALYKEKGVNPASGCVPTLLTFPVLFAFYSLLSQSIELRGAPFAGWIHDLSTADPYYVLPILMGVTMVWQQRLMPASADPAQQKVMMIMPLVFTVTMLFSASGVVLYWFVSQVWAIGQQYFTNWKIGPPVSGPVKRAVPAKR